MRQMTDIENYEHSRIQPADFNLIRDTAKGLYVEVGTFHGASAFAAEENADKVWTIDIYDWQPKVYGSGTFFFLGTSVDFINTQRQEIDILFIDGSHELDSVQKDIESLTPLVKKGGMIMFHDYKKESHTGVYRAVQEYLKDSGNILLPRTEGSSIARIQI